MNILVTGVAGMIGSYLANGLIDAGYNVIGIDKHPSDNINITFFEIDLGDAVAVRQIIKNNNIDRVIHLAALAHTAEETDLSYEKYYHVNVECAQNVFKASGTIPLLFISTVDVYGFTEGIVKTDTLPHPITYYGKTKALAENECMQICKNYTIFRFSPVYTDTIKRDIQKRYYLKYPYIAYQIGKGTEYEVLNIKYAISKMVTWCSEKVENNVKIIKDATNMLTTDYIKKEKSQGRAKIVIYFPKCFVFIGYKLLKALIGENKYTYLLNKAINPLKTE